MGHSNDEIVCVVWDVHIEIVYQLLRNNVLAAINLDGHARGHSGPAVATCPRSGKSLGWLIVIGFVPLVAGYHLSYLYRSINATLAPELVRALALDPATLGFMTSIYFLTFAAAQIPLGLALDRFGPRSLSGSWCCSSWPSPCSWRRPRHAADGPAAQPS
jgi:hypothetical protein